jgi:predicted Zn finger-like uncharacterized protein
MSLATRCTACGITFRVVQDQLRVSEGWVRCGQCREVFNALEQLFDLDRDGWPAQARPPTPDPSLPPSAVDAPPPATSPASPAPSERAPAPVPHAEQERGDGAASAPADAAAAGRVDLSGLELPSLDLPGGDGPPHLAPETPAEAVPDADPPVAAPAAAPSAGSRDTPTPAAAAPVPPRASELLAFESLDDDEAPLLPPLDADDLEPNREAVPSLYATLDEAATVPDAATFLAPELDDADGDDTIRLPDVPSAAPAAGVRDPDVAVDEWAVEAAHERPSPQHRSADPHPSRKRRHARRHAPVVHVSARDQLDFSDARFDSNLLEEEGVLAGVDSEAPATTVETPPETAVTPDFLRRAEQSAHWRGPMMRAALIAASVALGALLVLQATNHFRDDFAVRWPALRPALVAWCGIAGCRLEAPRHIDDVSVENTALARAGADAFRLAVTLRNHAAVAVALPAVDLSLTDASGVLVARRALHARDFKAPEVLPPNGEAELQAPIATRNLRVSGYTVEIFYP